MPPDGRCDDTFAQTRRCSISSCHLRTGRADASQPGAWWRSRTMKPAAVETPLARRFAAALATAEPERVRIRIELYTAAFLVAAPALATSPDRRARLGAAIEELIEAGVIAVSRAVDRS